MRGPLAANQDEEDPPNWRIWEYDIPTDTLRRVIDSNTTGRDDIGPQYLPDGRILFSSTRQRQSKAVLLDEGKSGFEAQTENRSESAFVLHVMNPDGSDIQQITFNQSHDLWPSVLADGRVLFTPAGMAQPAAACTCTPPTPTAPTCSCCTAPAVTGPAHRT